MRLIDADALKEKRYRMHSEFLGTVSVVAARDIDEAPTIDAVPVDKIHFTDLYLDGIEAIAVFKFGNQGITLRKKCEDFAPVVHGRWIKKVGRAECSVCHDECWADSAMEYKHCPNCGAKMDGETDV